MSDNTNVSNAIEEIDLISQTIINAAARLAEVGKTIDSNSEDVEQELLTKLHRRVAAAKAITANLDYVEPSSSSCSCLIV